MAGMIGSSESGLTWNGSRWVAAPRTNTPTNPQQKQYTPPDAQTYGPTTPAPQATTMPVPQQPRPSSNQPLTNLVNPTPPQGGWQQAYRQSGGGWGGLPHQIPITDLQGNPAVSGAPNFMQQLMNLVGAEQGRSQELLGGRYSQGQNGSFERNQGMIDQIGRLVGGMGGQMGQVTGQVGQSIGALDGQMQDLLARQSGQFESAAGNIASRAGQGFDQFRGFLDDARNTIGQVAGDLKGAYQNADDAINSAKNTYADYAKTGQSDIAAAAMGFANKAKTAVQQANSRFRPDGTVKSADEMAAEKTQLSGELGVQQAQIVGGMQEHMRDTLATLGNQIASFQSNAANVRLQGGQIRLGAGQALGQLGDLSMKGAESEANIGLNLNQQRLAVQQGQRDMLGMVGGLRQYLGTLQSSNMMNVLQMQLQGMTNQAQFQQQNPESMSSLFSGMATLFGMMTAPGAGNIGPIQFPRTA